MIKAICGFFTFSSLLFSNDGALLFNGNCVTCHNEVKEISAPSMRDVRNRYISAFSDKKNFVKYISGFVISPSQEKSIMQDKILKYKLMPLLGYEKSVINEVASYIYDTEF